MGRRKGDAPRPPLTDEQRELAARYVPLANGVVRRMRIDNMSDVAEFRQVVRTALVEAAGSFDPARNVKFGTFARWRIRGAICDARRALLAATRNPDDPFEAGGGLLYADLAGLEARGCCVFGCTPDAAVGSDVDEAEALESWLGHLTSHQAEVMRHVYLHGQNQSEAARRMGLSKSRVCVLHAEALDILKDVAVLIGLHVRDGSEAPCPAA